MQRPLKSLFNYDKIQDGGTGNHFDENFVRHGLHAVFLDFHDGMVAACLSLPGTQQLHHLWDAP